MRKILFVIANYKDQRQEIFERYYSPRNEEYARRHGFEYIVLRNTPPLYRNNPTWWKFTVVRDMLESGELRDGDKLTHFDADMVIVDGSKSYETEKSFSYAIDNGNTHCMGNYSITVNAWSRQLINLILDEQLFEKRKESKHWKEFREQAAWYTLTGTLMHSYRPFTDFPNFGWHSHVTEDTRFSIEELHQHVEVRGAEWNNTLVEDEFDSPDALALKPYHIIHSKREDMIIRHFAGGQPWRVAGYCDRPL